MLKINKCAYFAIIVIILHQYQSNPRIFLVRFGILQKSVKKTSDFSRIADSWNFSGLRIFSNFLKGFFSNQEYLYFIFHSSFSSISRPYSDPF